MQIQHNKLRVYFIIFFAAMGGMLYGYDIGIINSAFLFINKDIPMSTFQMSLLGGSVLFGGALAILVAGYIADWIGRKKTLVLSAIIFIVSVGLIELSTDYIMLFTSRMVQGVAVGFIVVTVPIYLTETVPDNIRGLAVTSFQLFLTAGILIANYVGLIFEDSENWRGMFSTALIPAGIFLVGCFFLIQSPRWLLMKNKEIEAEKAFIKILGHNGNEELIKAQQTILHTKQNSLRLRDIFTDRKYLKPISIVLAIAILTQTTGINSILQFSATILKSSGLNSNYASIIGGITITAVNFLITLVSVFIADRVERKFVVLVSTFMVALSLIYTSLVIYLVPLGGLQGYMLLAGLVVFILFFALGPGAYVFLMMSELLPTHIRSKVLAIALFLNSIMSSIVAAVFLPLGTYCGMGASFMVCGLCTLFYGFVIFKFVPKTTGKSLEDIEKELIG